LKEGDKVRARIVTVSLKRGAKAGKIGLTMRQPGLGKLEWIEEAEKEAKA
jgi:DNA-directed RNA polymerase subunit E'